MADLVLLIAFQSYFAVDGARTKCAGKRNHTVSSCNDDSRILALIKLKDEEALYL